MEQLLAILRRSTALPTSASLFVAPSVNVVAATISTGSTSIYKPGPFTLTTTQPQSKKPDTCLTTLVAAALPADAERRIDALVGEMQRAISRSSLVSSEQPYYNAYELPGDARSLELSYWRDVRFSSDMRSRSISDIVASVIPEELHAISTAPKALPGSSGIVHVVAPEAALTSIEVPLLTDAQIFTLYSTVFRKSTTHRGTAVKLLCEHFGIEPMAKAPRPNTKAWTTDADAALMAALHDARNALAALHRKIQLLREPSAEAERVWHVVAMRTGRSVNACRRRALEIQQNDAIAAYSLPE